jgi:hypothetical protein
MNCKWCDGEKDPFDYRGGLAYCSAECERQALEYAVRCMDALAEGKAPPDKETVIEQRERARRWTPDRMARRINELTERVHAE